MFNSYRHHPLSMMEALTVIGTCYLQTVMGRGCQEAYTPGFKLLVKASSQFVIHSFWLKNSLIRVEKFGLRFCGLHFPAPSETSFSTGLVD